MCGIAGIAGFDNFEAARSGVARMVDQLKLRGPDDEGIESWDTAILGHRRLSIFDLSADGHQPMLADDRSAGIVFNGAIYNFHALRKKLEAKGYAFRSRTDTEVLLHGYREWGIDELVSRIDGMFAFALWDERRKTLFLVRDRLGVKPLAFSISNGRIAFATTVRALKVAGFAGGINDAALIEYLEFGFLTDRKSIYDGVQKVKAAEIVEWSGGNLDRRSYWQTPTEPDALNVSFDEAVEETERLFLDAVEKRLQADVPVGALLSGGIDSSLVCWAIGKLGADVTAFTVGTPGDMHDESAVAAKTAKALGVKHQIIKLSDEKPPAMDDLIEAFSEPFACASALGMLSISEPVSKSATVLLTGDGGDDVFLGYPEHKHFHLASSVSRMVPSMSTSLWRTTREIVPKAGPLKRAVSFLDYSFGGLGGVTNARDGLPYYQKNNLLGERLEGLSFGHRDIPWSVRSGRRLLSDFLEYDRETRFVGEYLPKVDGATMRFALEARSPFLDSRLWDFASTLPYDLRMHKGELKAILREIVRRRIGDSLAGLTKQGFIVPVQRWLSNHWRELVIDALRDSVLAEEKLINSDAVLRIVEKTPRGNSLPRQIWFIFVLECWLRAEKKAGRL